MLLKWALLGAIALAVACSDIPDDNVEDVGPDTDSEETETPVREGWSQAQKYYVLYERDGEPSGGMPFQEMFALRVKIFADEQMQEPVADAEVEFTARVEQF